MTRPDRKRALADIAAGPFGRPGWFQMLAVGLVLLFLAAPTLVVIPVSFSSASYLTFPPPGWSLQWYRRFFTSSAWMDATLRSLIIATLTALASIAFGISAALGLRRLGKLREWVRLVLLLPMIVPGIIIAIGAYNLYAGLGLIGSILGLTIAHTLIAFPFVAIVVSASLDKIDRVLELAAASLGAGPVSTFLHVTLPLIRPGIVSGALLAFITSFDEVVIAVFIGGSRSSTLPKLMWDSIRTEVDPTIGAISCLLILCSTVLMIVIGAIKPAR